MLKNVGVGEGDAARSDRVRTAKAVKTLLAACTHRIAKLGRRLEQVSRTEMALRLVRWLAQPVLSPKSFAEMVNAYRKELAFVDWARESVCRGEDVAGLSQAYQRLDRDVLARREEFNHTFARSLADWTSVGSTVKDVCGVEDVLSQVVARVAEADNRVLLIVLDGMSWAVCHELVEDVRRDHWFEATPEESSSPPVPVVAASRTSPPRSSGSRGSRVFRARFNDPEAVSKVVGEPRRIVVEH